MEGSFDQSTLDRLRAIEEIEIETRAADGAPAHRTIIWVVVDGQDRVLIRSVRGELGRWYREAVAHPACGLLVDGTLLPVAAVAAIDDDQVAACSRGLRAKYPRDASLGAMLHESVLGTTLRLLPR